MNVRCRFPQHVNAARVASLSLFFFLLHRLPRRSLQGSGGGGAGGGGGGDGLFLEEPGLPAESLTFLAGIQ